MTKQIALRIPDEYLARIDAAVKGGRYPNRTATIRAALESFLTEERDRMIAETYRDAYGASEQEDWVGATGAEAIAEVIDADSTG